MGGGWSPHKYSLVCVLFLHYNLICPTFPMPLNDKYLADCLCRQQQLLSYGQNLSTTELEYINNSPNNYKSLQDGDILSQLQRNNR